MTRIAIVGLALALTSACGATVPAGPGTGSGTGTGSGSGTGSGTGSGSGSGTGTSVSPRAGLWMYGELTPVTSTCSATTPHGEAGDFAIDQVAAASFRIVPGDGTGPFVCTADTTGFRCPDRASFVVDDRPSIDAVLTVHVTVTGRFGDAAHGTGRQDASVACAGTQCALIGGFPCNFTVDFAIEAQ